MQNIIRYRHEIIWGLLLISLPFSKALINIVLALGLLVFFYDHIKNKISYVSINKSVLLLFIVFIYLTVNALIKAPYSENQSFFKLYPILIIAYLALFNTSHIKIKNIKILSIIVCGIYVCVCILKIIYYYYSESNINPFGNSNIINELLFIERPYAGCFVLLNILLVFDKIISSAKKKNRMLYIGLLVLFIGFVVLIAARLALITLFILTVIYLIFYVRLSLFKKFLGLLAVPLICVFIIFTSKGIQQRLFINESVEVFKDYEPRFIIWKQVIHILESQENNLISGSGNYKDIQAKLLQGYQKIEKDDKRNFYLNEKFNTHNQFFDFLLFGGILALVTVLVAFFSLSYDFKKKFIAFSIFFSLILFMLVENIFHRQTGCYLFIIYFVLALKINEVDVFYKHHCKLKSNL